MRDEDTPRREAKGKELPAVDPNAAVLELAAQLEARDAGRPKIPVAAPTKPKPSRAPAILLGVGLAVLLGAGIAGWLFMDSGDPPAPPAAQQANEPSTEELLDAPLPGESRADKERDYLARVEDAAQARGFEVPALEALRQPNAFTHPIDFGSPKLMAAGSSRREGPLALRVKVENVHIERGGVETSTKHTKLEVQNKAAVPVAYRLEVRKGGAGDCKSQAVLEYDSMVLDPGQKANIAICAGSQAVEILDLRTLEVTPLGAAWIRKLPPEAVDQPAAAVEAHAVAYPVEFCDPRSNKVAAAIKQSESAWEDVVDFYSRHDCEKHWWWPAYRRAEAPVGALPLDPPPGAVANSD